MLKCTIHVAYPPPPRTVCCCRRRYPLTAADNATRHDVSEKEKGSKYPIETHHRTSPNPLVPLEVTPALAGSAFSGSPTHPSAAPEAPGADEHLPNLAAVERVGVDP